MNLGGVINKVIHSAPSTPGRSGDENFAIGQGGGGTFIFISFSRGNMEWRRWISFHFNRWVRYFVFALYWRFFILKFSNAIFLNEYHRLGCCKFSQWYLSLSMREIFQRRGVALLGGEGNLSLRIQQWGKSTQKILCFAFLLRFCLNLHYYHLYHHQICTFSQKSFDQYILYIRAQSCESLSKVQSFQIISNQS